MKDVDEYLAAQVAAAEDPEISAQWNNIIELYNKK